VCAPLVPINQAPTCAPRPLQVNYVLLTERIDTVLHFAAETHVDNSFGSSLEFSRSNILGTHVMLEAARAHMPTLRRFIHVSTDEVRVASHQCFDLSIFAFALASPRAVDADALLV
jgi:dTDP-D-glucose 4,6-dehydratase